MIKVAQVKDELTNIIVTVYGDSSEECLQKLDTALILYYDNKILWNEVVNINDIFVKGNNNENYRT